MSAPLTVALPDLTATELFGARLAKALLPGSVVALVGPLGAGKTYLVRAIARALRVADHRTVSSPTFVLIQEYEGRLPIYHFDAYRLKSSSEFAGLGAEEYFSGKGVCLIEWADRMEEYLPKDHLLIELEVIGPSSRRMTITARGARYEEMLKAIDQ
jgi:tRNA threonylcarbamoyladenosine biosynthesis protein TsaE